MRGDEGDEVEMGERAGLVFVPTPCPSCGAKTEKEAETMCRPTSDETGERSCNGDFNAEGISVQATPESIAELDRWCTEQAQRDDDADAMARNVFLAEVWAGCEHLDCLPGCVHSHDGGFCQREDEAFREYLRAAQQS